MYFITTKRMLEVCFSAPPNIQYRTQFGFAVQGNSRSIPREAGLARPTVIYHAVKFRVFFKVVAVVL